MTKRYISLGSMENFHIYDDAESDFMKSDGLAVGEFLKVFAGGVISTGAAGAGDVSGPASSVDNTVPRWDGTGGDVLQGSGVSISDTDYMTVPGGIRLQGASDVDNDKSLYFRTDAGARDRCRLYRAPGNAWRFEYEANTAFFNSLDGQPWSLRKNGAIYHEFFFNAGAVTALNKAQADIDLRILGTTDSDLFFVNAGLDRVGISTSTPASTLHVAGTFQVLNGTSINNIITDDTLSTASNDQLGTVLALKTYIDNAVGGADSKVAVDSLATSGYLGVSRTDGVLRFSGAFSYVDYGDYVGIDVNEANIGHDALSGFVSNEHIDWTSATQDLVTTGKANLNSATSVLEINGVQVVKAQESHIADASTSHSVAFVGASADEILTQDALNALGAKINSILSMLETHGLVATS